MSFGTCSAVDFDAQKAEFIERHRASMREIEKNEVIEISEYAPPSFWTVNGSKKKAAALKRKKFPRSLKGQKFVTLTIDRSKYDSPQKAYDVGTRHLRQFFYLLREKYDIPRYLWKLEFHEPDDNGDIWPHWHLVIDYKRKIDAADIARAWAKGRTEIKLIDDEGFDYLTKYVMKQNDLIPEWIADRCTVRCWQTSRGYYKTAEDEALPFGEEIDTFESEIDEIIKEAQAELRLEEREKLNDFDPLFKLNKETIRQRVIRWLSLCQIKIVKQNETIYFSTELKAEWKKTILQVARIAVNAVDFIRELTRFELHPRKIIIPLKTCLQQQQLLQLILLHPCKMGALS